MANFWQYFKQKALPIISPAYGLYKLAQKMPQPQQVIPRAQQVQQKVIQPAQQQVQQRIVQPVQRYVAPKPQVRPIDLLRELPKASLDVGKWAHKNLIQPTAQVPLRLGASISKQDINVPKNPLTKFWFGEKPVKGISGYGQETLQRFGVSPQTAKKYALPIGIAATALDVSGIGAGSLEKKLAKEGTEVGVRKLLSKRNYSDDIIKAIAKEKNAGKIGELLKQKAGEVVGVGNDRTYKQVKIAIENNLKDIKNASGGKNPMELTKRNIEGFIPKSNVSAQVRDLINQREQLRQELFKTSGYIDGSGIKKENAEALKASEKYFGGKIKKPTIQKALPKIRSLAEGRIGQGIKEIDAKQWGAQIKDGNIVLYHGTNDVNFNPSKLNYGTFLSSVKKGADITGNQGASSYGKFLHKLELPLKDVKVNSTGEFQYIGNAKNLMNQKYSSNFYKAYNDYFGSNLTPEDINKQSDIWDIAKAISGYDENKAKLLLTGNKTGKILNTIQKSVEGGQIGQGIKRVGDKLPKDSQSLLDSARKNIKNLDEPKIIQYAQRIANFDKSKTIKPQYLAEALQYRDISPDFNAVYAHRIFQRQGVGFEQMKRMQELGITEGLDQNAPKILQNIQKKYNQLEDSTSKDLIRMAVQRLFPSKTLGLLPEQLTSKELSQIDNVFNIAEKIRSLSNETKMKPFHIAEALQYRNLSESIKQAKASKTPVLLNRLKELGLLKENKIQPTIQKAIVPPNKPPIKPPITEMPKELPNIPDKDLIGQMTNALKQAKPIRGAQEALYTKARGQKFARMMAAREKMAGEKGLYEELGALKGELPKAEFEPIRQQFNQQSVDRLFNIVKKTPNLNEWDKINAQVGLSKLLGEKGFGVPTRSEIEKMYKVFGKDFTETLLSKRPVFEKIKEGGMQLYNLPRSMMAGMLDFSATMMQNMMFAYRHPVITTKNFVNQVKYFANDNFYKTSMAEIAQRPNAKLYDAAKLSFTDVGPLMQQREEAFMSSWAEKIPGLGRVIKATGRAYTGFLNRMRADVADQLINTKKLLGESPDNPRFLESMGYLVNAGTGRGDLGKAERISPILGQGFFSARKLAAGVNMLDPRFYLKADPVVRKEALKTWLAFLGGAGTITGLAKLAGADVSMDFTSADAGKVKVGNTRFNLFGPYQQMAVLFGRMFKGYATSSTTGRKMTLGEGYRPLTRLELVGRFFESKEHPTLSLLTGALEGQNQIGDKFDWSTEALKRFIPMVAADAYDLYKEHGDKGLMGIVPTILGIPAQTYGSQIPKLETTDTGQPKITLKNVPDLAESIIQKITGQPASNIPKEQWPAILQQKQTELKTEIQKEQINETLKKAVKQDKTNLAQYDGSLQSFADGSIGVLVNGELKTFDSEAKANIAIAKNEFEKSGKKASIIGDNYFYKKSNGEIGYYTKPEFEDKVRDQQMEVAYENEDYKTWTGFADTKLAYLQSEWQAAEGDPLAQITLENKIIDLTQKMAKYKSYGGAFKKPKKSKAAKAAKKARTAINTIAKKAGTYKLKYGKISMPKAKKITMPNAKAPTARRTFGKISKLSAARANRSRARIQNAG